MRDGRVEEILEVLLPPPDNVPSRGQQPPTPTAEDDSTKVIYAKVKFSNRKVVSPPRASCSTINDVIYAEPRINRKLEAEQCKPMRADLRDEWTRPKMSPTPVLLPAAGQE
ncbi:hypothetical protein ILYODFUR_030847 [Ilyodon furcidens]|uniref:Uncharacterized protein n=1 Tax=Ilyodon furcidens TaxID=33524 RepID=A0ABV0U9W8_9TELE